MGLLTYSWHVSCEIQSYADLNSTLLHQDTHCVCSMSQPAMTHPALKQLIQSAIQTRMSCSKLLYPNNYSGVIVLTSSREVLEPISMKQSPSLEAIKQYAQVVMKFPAFYGTKQFIAMFISLHCSQSSNKLSQSTSSNPTRLRSILILSLHLHLGLYMVPSLQAFQPSVFTYFSSPPCATPITSSFDLINNILSRLQIMELLLMRFSLASRHEKC